MIADLVRHGHRAVDQMGHLWKRQVCQHVQDEYQVDIVNQKRKKGPVGQTGKLSAHTGDTQTEGKIDQVPVKVAGGLILLI